MSYLLALGRLEPFEKRVGREQFSLLRHVLRGELGPGGAYRSIQHAIGIINELLAEQ